MLLCTLIIHNFHKFFKTFLVLGMKATMVKRVQTDLKEMMAMATMLAMLLAASTSCIWRLYSNCSSSCCGGRVGCLYGRAGVGSEGLVAREHVGVALAGVVH